MRVPAAASRPQFVAVEFTGVAARCGALPRAAPRRRRRGGGDSSGVLRWLSRRCCAARGRPAANPRQTRGKPQAQVRPRCDTRAACRARALPCRNRVNKHSSGFWTLFWGAAGVVYRVRLCPPRPPQGFLVAAVAPASMRPSLGPPRESSAGRRATPRRQIGAHHAIRRRRLGRARRGGGGGGVDRGAIHGESRHRGDDGVAARPRLCR